MTLFQSRYDEPRGLAGGKRFPIAKVRNRLKPLFKAIHEAIVTAKMRRLRNELTFHSAAPENRASTQDADAATFPQRPLILGDKWDF
jgi:hypothetical protein